MENASAASLDAIRRSMRSIRQVLGSTVIDPALLTSTERIHYDGFGSPDRIAGARRAPGLAREENAPIV